MFVTVKRLITAVIICFWCFVILSSCVIIITTVMKPSAVASLRGARAVNKKGRDPWDYTITTGSSWVSVQTPLMSDVWPEWRRALSLWFVDSVPCVDVLVVLVYSSHAKLWLPIKEPNWGVLRVLFWSAANIWVRSRTRSCSHYQIYLCWLICRNGSIKAAGSARAVQDCSLESRWLVSEPADHLCRCLLSGKRLSCCSLPGESRVVAAWGPTHDPLLETFCSCCQTW